jgi:AcrR family transcriptional regulator
MARVTKDPYERRRELIACARELFYSKGYESTSVRDIVDGIGVAKGTFYYYFDSKLAILEAMVEEMIGQSVALLHEIVADETLPVLEKWAQAFQVVAAWKTERKAEMLVPGRTRGLAILHVTQKDENILLQYKIRTQSVQMLSPEFARIITQGVEEGVFNTDFVEDSALIALSIMQTLYDTFAGILLNPDYYDDAAALARRKITSVETAIERVLGAPPGSLSLIDEQTFAAWFQDWEPASRKLCPEESVVSTMELDELGLGSGRDELPGSSLRERSRNRR